MCRLCSARFRARVRSFERSDEMNSNRTFGQRLAMGLIAVVAITIAIGIVAILALRNVVAGKDRVISVDTHLLLNGERLATNTEAKSAAARAFLLTSDDNFLAKMRDARAEFDAVANQLLTVSPTDELRTSVRAIVEAEREHRAALDRVVAQRR